MLSEGLVNAAEFTVKLWVKADEGGSLSLVEGRAGHHLNALELNAIQSRRLGVLQYSASFNVRPLRAPVASCHQR